MTLTNGILIIFIGVSAGIVVSGGLYAFIAMVGVLTRLATRTKTADHVNLYETIVILGAALGNSFYILKWRLPFGNVVLGLYGLFSGIFIGCLAVALAEVINVIPVFSRRIKLKKGVALMISIMGVSKAIGTLLQFWYIYVR